METKRRFVQPSFINILVNFFIINVLLLVPIKVWGGGPNLTLPFAQNYRITCNFTCYPRHGGTDYATPNKTPILATNNGKVSLHYSKGPGNYGYWIEINHGNGFSTRYAHLDSYSIEEGKSINRGVQIALSGNSGGPWDQGNGIWRSPYHLHFEVRQNGIPGDPYTNNWWSTNPPSLPNQVVTSSSNPTSNSSSPSDPPPPPTPTFPLNHIGWLDAHTHEPHATHLAVADYGGGSFDGVYLGTNSPDQDIHYYQGWNGNPIYQDHALNHLFYIKGHGKKVVTMTSGKFDGGRKKYLAVAYQGSDLVYFYYNNQRVGVLDTHGGRPQVTHLAAGDVDRDGKDELFVATSTDDHIYMYDNWHKLGEVGFTLDKIERNWLDAHGGNPTIAALACMDIDANGYDELLAATTGDDHVYAYFYTGNFSFGRRNEVNFVKQGYVNGVENNAVTQDMTVGKFKGPDGVRDYLAVLTSGARERVNFYWERDLNQPWGKILRKNGFISVPDGKPLVDLGAGDISKSEGEELVLASKDNDHINFFGYQPTSGGGTLNENSYDAKLISKSDEKVLMRPGEEKELWIEYQNKGEAFWFKKSPDTSDLVTDQPLKRNSALRSSSWPEQWKPATLTREVKPNEKIKYQFKIKAPQTSEKFNEAYALYNGQENNLYKNSKASFEIIVDGEPPTKVKNLRGDLENSIWNGTATNDSTPSFLWDEAEDRLSEIDGYFVAVDDVTPDGQKNLDEWVGNKTSWTAPQPLSEGNHIFTVTSKDKLGNINPENTNRLGDAPYLQFLVDLSPPSAPQNLTPKIPDSRWHENITNDSTPTFTWQEGSDQYSGIDGYFVSIDDSQFSNKGTLNFKTQNLEFTLPQELSEGNHVIYVASTDKVGHISNPISYSFVVDRLGPQGQISFESSNQYTNAQQVVLNLAAKDMSPIVEYKLSNDGINWVSFPLTDLRNKLSITQSWNLLPSDGRRTVYVKFKDIFGQWSNVATNNIFLDKTNPTSWINGLPLFQNALSFLVSWAGNDLLSGIKWFDVQVKNSLEDTWADWLLHTNLASAVFNGIDGVTYFFRSRSEDFVGNVEDYGETEDAKTTVDITAPPPPAINSPQRNSTLSASADQNPGENGIQVTVEGNAEANATLTLKIQNEITEIYNTKVSAQGTWSISNVTLYEERNTLEAKATDDAGNFNISEDYYVFLDTIAPAKISDLNVSNITYNSVTLSWTAPGDDENLGTAKNYDLRYSKNPIVGNADFENATKVSSPPLPEIAGTGQTFTVENLESKETYYFAIKTSDEVENWSEISNTAEATTETSAYRIELASSKNTVEAEGIETITLTATVYNQKGETGEKLAGEPVTMIISDENSIPTETGNLSSITDNGDGTYTSIYTSATKVGDGKITITAENQQCTFQKQDSVNINLIPGAPSGTISLIPNPASLPANGTSTSTITSGIIFDRTQNVVANGEKITVDTNLGTITNPDQDLALPGTQALTTNGVIQFTLKSSIWNGEGQSETAAQLSTQSARGQASGTTQVTFRDVTAPAPPQITEPPSGTISNNNTPTIRGRAEKNSRVLIYKNGVYHYYTYADSNGNFSYTFGSALSDGNWVFQTKARDAAGNTSNSSNSVNYTIDTQPPQILDFAPKGTLYHHNEVVWATYQDNSGGSGINTARNFMKINGATVSANITSTKISYASNFDDGTHNVQVKVFDRAGNSVTKNWSFKIQTASHFKSAIDSSYYRSSVVSDWPASRGLIPSPNWWDPSFDDSRWSNRVYESNLRPNSVPLPDPESVWLWGDSSVNPNETTLLRKRFTIPSGVTITEAAIRMSADEEAWGYAGYVNGVYFGKVPEAGTGQNPYTFGLTNLIHAGENLLAIQVSNKADNRAGYAFTMTVRYHD
jgi:hypothetical protein